VSVNFDSVELAAPDAWVLVACTCVEAVDSTFVDRLDASVDFWPSVDVLVVDALLEMLVWLGLSVLRDICEVLLSDDTLLVALDEELLSMELELMSVELIREELLWGTLLSDELPDSKVPGLGLINVELTEAELADVGVTDMELMSVELLEVVAVDSCGRIVIPIGVC
jgi:hypothetical protein